MADYFPILDLPKEILLKEIIIYFNFLDIKNFRLVCKRFRDLTLSNTFCWQQMIPYNQLFLLKGMYVNLSISSPPIYGTYLQTLKDLTDLVGIDIDILREYKIQYLNMFHICKIYPTIFEKELIIDIVKKLSPSIKTFKLNIPRISLITEEFLIQLLTQFPNLKIVIEKEGEILHWCCQKQYFKLIKILVEERNVSVNIHDGWTLLFTCICYKANNLIEYCLKKGNNINFLTNERRTPLIIAMIYENFEAAEILLKNKALTEPKDNWGNDARFYAQGNKDPEKYIDLLNKYS